MSKYDIETCQDRHTLWKIPENTLTLHDIKIVSYNLVFKFKFKLRNIIYTYQVISLSVINTNDSHPHPRIHTGEKTFPCKICETYLMTHPGEKYLIFCYINSYHSVKSDTSKSKSIICSYLVIFHFSTNAYDYKQILRMHPMTHTGEKPSISNACDLYLKPQLCTFCYIYHFICLYLVIFPSSSNAYDNKQNCHLHPMIHTGEKPFESNICDLYHKPMPCTSCYIYGIICFKQTLHMHLMTHIGEKHSISNICDSNLKPQPWTFCYICNLCVSYHIVETNRFNHTENKHLCYKITHKIYTDNLTYLMPP